jgi:hypothetical protein
MAGTGSAKNIGPAVRRWLLSKNIGLLLYLPIRRADRSMRLAWWYSHVAVVILKLHIVAMCPGVVIEKIIDPCRCSCLLSYAFIDRFSSEP